MCAIFKVPPTLGCVIIRDAVVRRGNCAIYRINPYLVDAAGRLVSAYPADKDLSAGKLETLCTVSSAGSRWTNIPGGVVVPLVVSWRSRLSKMDYVETFYLNSVAS